MSTNPEALSAERRKRGRTRLSIPGRYMLSNRQEHPCTVSDVSALGLSLSGPVLGSRGDNVVVYIDDVGRIEGTVVRKFAGGFAIKFNAPSRASAAFAILEQLNRRTWSTQSQT